MNPNSKDQETENKDSARVESKGRAPIRKTKEIIKKLPAQKPHIEFISALLTIPVLITVLLLNLNNLKTRPSEVPIPTMSPTPSLTPDKQKISIPSSQPLHVTSVAFTGT